MKLKYNNNTLVISNGSVKVNNVITVTLKGLDGLDYITDPSLRKVVRLVLLTPYKIITRMSKSLGKAYDSIPSGQSYFKDHKDHKVYANSTGPSERQCLAVGQYVSLMMEASPQGKIVLSNDRNCTQWISSQPRTYNKDGYSQANTQAYSLE